MFRRSILLLTSSFLATSALFPLPVPAAAAQAQAVEAEPIRTVFGVRVLGSWLDDDDLRWTFKQDDFSYSKVTATVVREDTGELVANIKLAPGRRGLEGEVLDPISGKRLHTMHLIVDRDGSAWGYFHEKFRGVRNKTRLRRPDGHPKPANFDDWVGTWKTSRGQLVLEPQGSTFFGFVHRGEPLKQEERVAFVSGAATLTGAWEQGGEWTATLPRGDVVLALSRDGSKFSGYYTDVTTGRRVDWTGERVETNPSECGSTRTDYEKNGRFYAKVHKQVGHETSGGLVEYYTHLALFHMTNSAIALKPENVTVRIEGADGAGRTATSFWFDNGQVREEQSELRPISKCQNIFPLFRFIDLPQDQAKRAVLIVDGQRTKSWDITPYITRRAPSSPVPAPANGQSAPHEYEPTPGRGPVTNNSQPIPMEGGPIATASFKPLNRIDVRLDRVIVPRGYPTYQVHAFLTVKNVSPTPQYFTSGFMKVFLTDADGVSLERSQPYRASGEPAELFGATPVIQPGGELKVRYIFLPERDAQLTSLSMSEGDERAEFAVSGL